MTVSARDRDEIIEALENNEELRKRFYEVVLGHTMLHHQVISLDPAKVHTTIEYSGLYESEPTDKVRNEDFDFLLYLLWRIE